MPEGGIKLLVGLGNPGEEYSSTRHNAGFMAVDAISDRFKFSKHKSKFSASLSEGEIDGIKVIVIKPMTYMNLSGNSVSQACRFYKIAPADVFVFHDELDLLSGKVKVKLGGGAAGHNGLKSLDSAIGKEYWRVRIGIGHPGDRNQVSDYVLSNFSKAEMKEMEIVISKIAEYVPLLISGKPELFMNDIAKDTK